MLAKRYCPHRYVSIISAARHLIPLAMMQYDFKRNGRKCSVTGDPFQPGEEFVSALMELDDGEMQRQDFSLAAWESPPDNCIGWWKSRVPIFEEGRVFWAPRDVLISYFDHLHDSGQQPDHLYVMSLLMVRKHIMKLVETVNEGGAEIMRLFRSSDKTKYRIRVVDLTAQQIEQIQNELGEKLFTSSSPVEETE